MTVKDGFISVRDFALISGKSKQQVEGQYTIELGDRLLVPRFMLEPTESSGVAHIELTPEIRDKPDSNEVIATIKLDPADFTDGEFANFKLDASLNIAHELNGDDTGVEQNNWRTAPSKKVLQRVRRRQRLASLTRLARIGGFVATVIAIVAMLLLVSPQT